MRASFPSTVLALTLAPLLVAQNTTQQPANTRRTPPQPQAQQAPGAGPDKVWLNEKSNVYHCPGDRYYGKTKDGKYVTEPEAKKAGAHGARNQTCFK